jgi:pilus assembly protein Flp/PilA
MLDNLKLALAILKSDRRGVTALEYGLIAGVLVTVIATAFNVFGTGLSSAFSSISASL